MSTGTIALAPAHRPADKSQPEGTTFWDRTVAAQADQPRAEKLRPKQTSKTQSEAHPIRSTADSQKGFLRARAAPEARAGQARTTDLGGGTRDLDYDYGDDLRQQLRGGLAFVFLAEILRQGLSRVGLL